MTAPDIERTVKTMAEKAFKTTIDLDETPIEDVGDSLTLTELVVGLEQHYNIALDERITGRVRKVRDLVTEVARLLAARPPS